MCKTHLYINRKEEAEKTARMETEIHNLTNLLKENVQKSRKKDWWWLDVHWCLNCKKQKYRNWYQKANKPPDVQKNKKK